MKRIAYRADAALSWLGGCIALAVIGAVAGIDYIRGRLTHQQSDASHEDGGC